MNKTPLIGLFKTLILLIGQSNDLLERLIRDRANSTEHLHSFNHRTSPDSEIFLNTKEACELLKCSSVTLWKLRKSNKIPFLKKNTTVRFRRTDIINYITKTR